MNFSPYTALGSNQQTYVVGANSRNNRNNLDYYDYYDYGGSSAVQQQRFQQQPLQQQRFLKNNNNNLQLGAAGSFNRRMSNMKSAASGGYGSYSGDDYCDNGISIGLLLTAALGIAVMFYTLYTKITMAGGRRRKKRAELEEVEEEIDPISFSLDHITDILYSGNEIEILLWNRHMGNNSYLAKFLLRPTGKKFI